MNNKERDGVIDMATDVEANANLIKEQGKIYSFVGAGMYRGEMRLICTFVANAMGMGYIPCVVDFMKIMDKDELLKYSDAILKSIMRVSGMRNENELLYPNFPKECMSIDESDRFYRALEGYVTDGRLPENYPSEYKSCVLFDGRRYQLLGAFHIGGGIDIPS